MIYELYLEGQLADIRQDLGMQLSYAIDDVNKYGSRETSFSKTIVLPGTANNNKLLGFVAELGSNNPIGGANINSSFNPAQITNAELRANGLLLLKGVFRLTGIVKDGELIEYEGNLFGELGGFISAIGNGKLEDLDFSEYNHDYTFSNIVASWNNRSAKDVVGDFFDILGIIFRITIKNTYDLKLNVGDSITITNAFNTTNNKTYEITSYSYDTSNSTATIGVDQSVFQDVDDTFTIEYKLGNGMGSGYFYPLIDYGGYKYTLSSTSPFSYSYETFRPALFVKEYIDKMFINSGYTYESQFFNTAFFKRLVIPNNTDTFKKIVTKLLDAESPNPFIIEAGAVAVGGAGGKHEFQFINLIDNLTGDGDPDFTFTGNETQVNINLIVRGYFLPAIFASGSYVRVRLYKNTDILFEKNYTFPPNILNNPGYDVINFSDVIILANNDIIYLQIDVFSTLAGFVSAFESEFISLKIEATKPTTAPLELGDSVLISDILPRNILQKDFLTWIMKMFNLYITEDKIKNNHLIIEPYNDYYDLTEYEDWTYKVARDKPWNIKPMGMLNGRFFEYKYKDDNDFYNEGYKKKFNQSYGDRLHDTQFPFSKDKQTTDIGFSPSVLIQYTNDGTPDEKIVSAIYKRSKGNSVDQEERMDSNIRIMQVKLIEGVASWRIGEPTSTPGTYNNIGSALTGYGYAGHFDDPVNPTIDINFGAASEIFFTPNSYPTNNLFNTYWSGYIGEIADKDSKLLTCHVYLTELDIAQLDFSKPVFIDGSLWRINKIMDFDASSGELTKVELLKVINNG